jgi:hypothetical protein
MTDIPYPEEPEVRWTSYVDTLIRWRRFVLGGLAISFAALVAWATLGPRGVECEATLALPSAEAAPLPTPGATPASVGVSLATYKEVERTFADSAAISVALAPHLTENEIRKFQRTLSSHFMAVTTNPRDEFARITRDDTITAVRLSYADGDAARAEAVIGALADLVRRALSTRTAQRAVETGLLKSIVAAERNMTMRATLAYTNDSLKLQETDLGRLTSSAGESSGRQVVDVTEGGYRYLPPAVQLVGVKALRADNEHKMRLAERMLAVERLNEAFLRGLSLKIEAECNQAHLLADAPALLDREIQTFFAVDRSGPEVDLVRDQLRTQHERWRHQAENVRYIQYPTSRPARRAMMLAGSGAVILLFFLLAPFVIESWLREHASPPSA